MNKLFGLLIICFFFIFLYSCVGENKNETDIELSFINDSLETFDNLKFQSTNLSEIDLSNFEVMDDQKTYYNQYESFRCSDNGNIEELRLYKNYRLFNLMNYASFDQVMSLSNTVLKNNDSNIFFIYDVPKININSDDFSVYLYLENYEIDFRFSSVIRDETNWYTAVEEIIIMKKQRDYFVDLDNSLSHELNVFNNNIKTNYDLQLYSDLDDGYLDSNNFVETLRRDDTVRYENDEASLLYNKVSFNEKLVLTNLIMKKNFDFFDLKPGSSYLDLINKHFQNFTFSQEKVNYTKNHLFKVSGNIGKFNVSFKFKSVIDEYNEWITSLEEIEISCTYPMGIIYIKDVVNFEDAFERAKHDYCISDDMNVVLVKPVGSYYNIDGSYKGDLADRNNTYYVIVKQRNSVLKSNDKLENSYYVMVPDTNNGGINFAFLKFEDFYFDRESNNKLDDNFIITDDIVLYGKYTPEIVDEYPNLKPL